MRTQLDYTPAEHAIAKAMQEVEKMPADVKLTEAVMHLGKARMSVQEYLDKQASDKNISTETI